MLDKKNIIGCENRYILIGTKNLLNMDEISFLTFDELIAPSCILHPKHIFVLLFTANQHNTLSIIFKIFMRFHSSQIHFLSIKSLSDTVKNAVECIGGTYHDINMNRDNLKTTIINITSDIRYHNNYVPQRSISIIEAQVIILYLSGHSVVNISQHLNRSPKTIHSHIYHILNKLKLNRLRDLFL